jgi:hypothetical protein
MNKPVLLATAALLLGTSVAGVALATPRLLEDRFALEIGNGDERSALTAGERFRVADSDHRRREEARGRQGKHDDDDDDDDDDDQGGRGRADRPGVTGPTDPATPVTDNGLFQGKTRPKVEVN